VGPRVREPPAIALHETDRVHRRDTAPATTRLSREPPKPTLDPLSLDLSGPGPRAPPTTGTRPDHGRSRPCARRRPPPGQHGGKWSTIRPLPRSAALEPGLRRSGRCPYDLVVKNGMVIDGSGLPRYRADVGVRHGRIAGIGRIRERASEVIDADGQAVAPGFVDGHTHMDAQIFWTRSAPARAGTASPPWFMGNCGFTLAPCRAVRQAPGQSATWSARRTSRPRRWTRASTGRGPRSRSFSTAWTPCPKASTTRATSSLGAAHLRHGRTGLRGAG